MATRGSLLAAIALFATFCLLAEPVQAQRESRRDAEEVQKQFPEATREEPPQQARRLQRQLSQLIEVFNEDDLVRARELAGVILAHERANAFERSVAAQVAGNAASDTEDFAAAVNYLQRAIDENGLSNEAHYSTMQNLAIAKLNLEDFAGAIAVMNRLVEETRTRNPEIFAAKAGAYFQAEQFSEAAHWVQQAIDASPEPRAAWLRLLQAAHLENDQPAEAIQVGERLLALEPDNRQLIFAQASAHLNLEQTEQALALIDGARQRGLLKDARDFRNAYSIYFNVEGRERDVIAVIQEGLAKGVLQRDLPTLNALAQAAYFSDQLDLAVQSYGEAAALDPTGETGLNFAKVLSAEGRDEEARSAARAALAKGLARPGEAWMVIARAESQLGTPASTRAALLEAAKHPETREQANRMLNQNR